MAIVSLTCQLRDQRLQLNPTAEQNRKTQTIKIIIMKKIIHIAMAVTFVTLLHSCKKQDELAPPTAQTVLPSTSPVKLEPMRPLGISFTLSDWFSMLLTPARNGSLYGRYELRKPITGLTDSDITLAYVRRNNQGTVSPNDGYHYSQLPAVVKTSAGEDADMNFELGSQLFEILISPGGSSPVMLQADDFKDCAYRYIVISKKDFERLNIDWNDYAAVALALGFTL